MELNIFLEKQFLTYFLYNNLILADIIFYHDVLRGHYTSSFKHAVRKGYVFGLCCNCNANSDAFRVQSKSSLEQALKTHREPVPG